MNGHHANGFDSRPRHRVEEESVPVSPHLPPGVCMTRGISLVSAACVIGSRV